ncbi:MAG: hypothetical protein KDD34_09580 [Bdellovibrionales bacterium]|nr:hypothetical protein [Bdellovibrionales bacterium]
MKTPHWKNADELEVWKFVACHLAKNGIDTVLVGGAVCAIYSEGIYKSGDLDLVSRSLMDHKIPDILKSIGFEKKSGRHYEHPECRIFVEFVTGPPGIGDDIDIKPDHLKVDGNKLYLYSPTDCIRDRLASYIHFKARECLDQAALVAKKHPFNHSKVKAWCEAEGAPDAFDDLMEKIKKM